MALLRKDEEVDCSQGAKIIIIILMSILGALMQYGYTDYPIWFAKYPSERGIFIPILHVRNLRLSLSNFSKV